MVLSNKKLKKKLRDATADSAAAPPVVDTLGGRADQVESMERKLGDGAHRLNLSKREKRRKVGGDGGGSGGDVLKSGKRKRWEGKSAGGEGGEMVVEAGAGSARRKKGKRKMEAVGIVDLLGSVRKLKSEKEKKEWKKGKSAAGEGGEMVVEAGAGSVRSKKGKRKMEAVGIVDLLGSVRKLKSEKEKKEWKKKKNRAGKKKKEKVGDKENRNGETGLIVVDHVDASGGNGATNKVYVGGIPYYSTEDDIRSFFESCGTISEVDCMSFPESGKFRGIAIITFKTEAAAKRALALDGADMGGLFLKIQPYRATRVQRPQPKPTDFSPKIIDGYNRIYVGNLSWEVTEDDLRKFFCDCSISSIRFGMDKETGEFRGYAHIDFSDDDSLLIALALDEKVVCGRPARIRCAVPLKATKLQGVASKDLLAKENGKSSSNQKKKRRTCYQCGIPGHLSSSCPNKSETPTLPV